MIATREHDALLISAGAAVTLIILLVLQSSLGSGLLSFRTVTMEPIGYAQVAGAYSSHLVNLDSRNITALVEGYERNATVEWTQSQSNGSNYRLGPIGNYTGWGEIQILLQNQFGRVTKNFSISDESQSISPDGSTWLVDSAFHVNAYNPVLGNINATVVAQDWYTQVFKQPALGVSPAGSWLISREIWNYTSFIVQSPIYA